MPVDIASIENPPTYYWIGRLNRSTPQKKASPPQKRKALPAHGIKMHAQKANPLPHRS
ncbi:hypothetical protein HMPREF1985_01442 [Mitsuokella sp. oral taxon 131 str. W9106]|nr:hypothetical protein HMPREF1985_01442 [Mitsuokella sp. oral taxon 131 str. W9106]